MRDFYQTIAPFYDALNRDVDHSAWADFAQRCFSLFPGKVESVLDLGCGTGSLTLELARRGYDMIGVDASENMLAQAQSRAALEGAEQRILWLCQDMRAFELYGTVEAAVCCLDGINHLESIKDLEECFRLVQNYLVPGGLFLFDVNSPYKFEKIFGDNAYVLEDGDTLCAWQNYYRKKSRLCDFYISLFTREADGRYQRQDSVERERMYTVRSLKQALQRSGMQLLDVYGGPELKKPEPEDERLYLVAKAVK